MSDLNNTPENEIEEEYIETGVVASEDSELLEEIGEENEEIDEEFEEDIDPLDVKVWGMPRMCFHGAAFGVAAGYILAGVIGILFDKTVSATTCAIACAVVGYFIMKQVHKKKKAEQAALLGTDLEEPVAEKEI